MCVVLTHVHGNAAVLGVGLLNHALCCWLCMRGFVCVRRTCARDWFMDPLTDACRECTRGWVTLRLSFVVVTAMIVVALLLRRHLQSMTAPVQGSSSSGGSNTPPQAAEEGESSSFMQTHLGTLKILVSMLQIVATFQLTFRDPDWRSPFMFVLNVLRPLLPDLPLECVAGPWAAGDYLHQVYALWAVYYGMLLLVWVVYCIRTSGLVPRSNEHRAGPRPWARKAFIDHCTATYVLM